MQRRIHAMMAVMLLAILGICAVSSGLFVAEDSDADVQDVQLTRIFIVGHTYMDEPVYEGSFIDAELDGMTFGQKVINNSVYTVASGTPTNPCQGSLTIYDFDSDGTKITQNLTIIAVEDGMGYGNLPEYASNWATITGSKTVSPGVQKIRIEIENSSDISLTEDSRFQDNDLKKIDVNDVGVSGTATIDYTNGKVIFEAELNEGARGSYSFTLGVSDSYHGWMFGSNADYKFRIEVIEELVFARGNYNSLQLSIPNIVSMSDLVAQAKSDLAEYNINYQSSTHTFSGTPTKVTSEDIVGAFESVTYTYNGQSRTAFVFFSAKVVDGYTVSFNTDLPIVFEESKLDRSCIVNAKSIWCPRGVAIPLPSFNSTETHVYFWEDTSTTPQSVGTPKEMYTPTRNITLSAVSGSEPEFTIKYADPDTGRIVFPIMIKGAQFRTPVPFTPTISGAKLSIESQTMYLDELELTADGYLQTKNFKKSNASIITMPVDYYDFTIKAEYHGQIVSILCGISVSSVNLNINHEDVKAGKTLSYDFAFEPNRSTLKDNNAVLVSVSQTSGGSGAASVSTTVTEYGCRITVGTAEFYGGSDKVLNYNVSITYNTNTYYGSLSFPMSITVHPTTEVDPTLVPSVQSITIVEHPTMPGYYIAYANGAVNVDTYTWKWDDNTQEENTATDQTIHYWKGVYKEVTVTLEYKNDNGKSGTISNSIIITDGSYNAFIGNDWYSPGIPVQKGTTPTFEFIGDWPSEPVASSLSFDSVSDMYYLHMSVPIEESLVGKTLTYKCTINGKTSTYNIGIFDQRSSTMDPEQIEVVAQNGYSVTVRSMIPESQILFDEHDNRVIRWTAYTGTSVVSDVVSQKSGISDPTFNFNGSPRQVLIQLSVLLPANNSAQSMINNFFTIVSVPDKSDESPNGDLDDADKIRIEDIDDQRSEINTPLTIDLPYEYVDDVRYGTYDGIAIDFAEDYSSITIMGTVANSYEITLTFIFLDETWGEVSFHLDIIDPENPSGGDEGHQPEFREMNLAERLTLTANQITSYVLHYKDVRSITYTPDEPQKLSIILKEGGNDFDYLEIVPLVTGEIDVTIVFKFDNGDFSRAQMLLVSEESSDEVDPSIAVLKFDDLKLTKGEKVTFDLEFSNIRIESISVQKDSDLKLSIEGSKVVIDNPDVGVYPLIFKLVVQNLSSNGSATGQPYEATTSFVVSIEEGSSDNTMMAMIVFGVAAASIVAVFVTRRII